MGVSVETKTYGNNDSRFRRGYIGTIRVLVICFDDWVKFESSSPLSDDRESETVKKLRVKLATHLGFPRRFIER